MKEERDSREPLHTLRKSPNEPLTCGFLNTSLACRIFPPLASRRVIKIEKPALTNTAAFLPTFRSSLGDRTDSMSEPIVLAADWGS